MQGDLEKDEDIKALLEATIKQFGKLDILVSVFVFHSESCVVLHIPVNLIKKQGTGNMY